MARYTERLDQLLNDGVLTQEQYDELADLSIAKDAIKEFNKVKSERDQFASKLEQFETAPKRKEALKRVGIDYDALPKYGQKALDGIPAEDLDNLEKVAEFVQNEGFEANLQTEQEDTGEQSGAEQIVAFDSSMGSGTPAKGKVTPDVYASWSPEKRRDFQQKNPEATEALKRGEEAPV